MVGKLLYDSVVGDGALAGGINLAHDGGTGHPQKGRVDGSFGFRENPFGYGDVFLFDAGGKLYRRQFVFGDDTDAGGVTVQPPQRAEGNVWIAVSEEIAQSVVKLSCCRVNENVIGFIEENEIFIFIEDRYIQTAVGGQHRLFIGKIDGDDVVFLNWVDIALKISIDEKAALLFKADQHRFGITLGAEVVAEAHTVVFACDGIGFYHENILICFEGNVKPWDGRPEKG